MSIVLGCNYCKKKRIPNFREHFKKEHPEHLNKHGEIPCPFCAGKTYYYSNILIHVRAIHPSKLIPLPTADRSQIDFYTRALEEKEKRIGVLERENDRLRERLRRVWMAVMGRNGDAP